MPKTYITLGRLGDILSVLPLLYYEHTKGERCDFVVSREYASILDGCSYLNPISFDGPYWDLERAFNENKIGDDKNLVVAQINGPVEVIEKYAYNRAGQKSHETDSFVKEQWKLAGKLPLWREQPPLVFDKRDEERELKLLSAYRKKTGRKLLLVHLGGNTAPFPDAPLLWELLKLKLGDEWQVTNLSLIQTAYFYDLLALYEQADALLACDSAPLHLAQAIPSLPVFALINDKPNYWHGTAWRPNHVWHCRYSDFAARALELFEILQDPQTRMRPLLPDLPALVHSWPQSLRVNGEETLAAESWGDMRNRLPVPIQPGIVGKDSILISDPERHPFLRSALQIPLMKARPQDIVLLTRATTAFSKSFSRLFTPEDCPCYAYRTVNGQQHPSTDLFAATRTFWESIWKEIPDFVLGGDWYWRRVLCEIFKAHGAKELKGAIYANLPPKPLRYKGFNAALPPRLERNQRLHDVFLRERNLGDLFPSIEKQSFCYPLNRASIPSHAYNPSICQSYDKLWMTYRFHEYGSIATRLGIAEIEPHGNAIRKDYLPLPGHSLEDARFFRFQKQRWLSWVESDYSGQPSPHSVVKIGELTPDWKMNQIIHPDVPGNDWTTMQKNYLFWDYKEQLMCLYVSDPEQRVFQLSLNGEIQEEWKTAPPKWSFGPIKGGCLVGAENDYLLRIFHSTLDLEDYPWRRRYYVGALLMKNEPPFEVTKISKEPILVGSADDDLSDAERGTITHYKGKVVFPGGVIRLADGFILAVGVNDSQCKLVKITDLKL